MKKTSARIISMLLAVFMVMSLAACGNGGASSSKTPSGTTSSTPSGTTSSTPAGSTPAGSTPAVSSTPVVEEPVEITIGLAQNMNVQDYDDNYLTKLIEENCNVDLKFELLASTSGDALTQIATRVAGNEKLPDILFGLSFASDVLLTYGKDGYLVDLTDYLNDEKLTADYRARLKELYGDDYWAMMMKAIKSADGKIYAFPSAVMSESDMPTDMIYINTTWLKQLGLEKPTTWDELVTVLRAFKTKDPNGNGKADEIPMLGGSNFTRCRIQTWLMNNFCYYNYNYYFEVEEGGKLDIVYDDPEFREGLKAMRKLHEEGLLSDLTFTMGKTGEIKPIWTPVDGVPIVGIMAAHIMNNGYMAPDSPMIPHYDGLLPLKGAYAQHGTTQPSAKASITTDAGDKIQKCFEIFLFMSTEKGSLAMRWGEENVDYKWETEANGQKAVRVLNSDAYGGVTKSTWNIGAAFCLKYGANTPYHGFLNYGDNATLAEQKTLKGYKYAADFMEYAAKANPKEIIDWTLQHNEEELDELGTKKADVFNHHKTSMAKFIRGEEGFDPFNDKDWENYVKTLKDYGIETWIKCGQSAYERWLNS